MYVDFTAEELEAIRDALADTGSSHHASGEAAHASALTKVRGYADIANSKRQPKQDDVGSCAEPDFFIECSIGDGCCLAKPERRRSDGVEHAR